MALEHALHERCAVWIVQGHDLIITEHGFRERFHRSKRGDEVYCADLLRRYIITKEAWLSSQQISTPHSETAIGNCPCLARGFCPSPTPCVLTHTLSAETMDCSWVVDLLEQGGFDHRYAQFR